MSGEGIQDPVIGEPPPGRGPGSEEGSQAGAPVDPEGITLQQDPDPATGPPPPKEEPPAGGHSRSRAGAPASAPWREWQASSSSSPTPAPATAHGAARKEKGKGKVAEAPAGKAVKLARPTGSAAPGTAQAAAAEGRRAGRVAASAYTRPGLSRPSRAVAPPSGAVAPKRKGGGISTALEAAISRGRGGRSAGPVAGSGGQADALPSSATPPRVAARKGAGPGTGESPPAIAATGLGGGSNLEEAAPPREDKEEAVVVGSKAAPAADSPAPQPAVPARELTRPIPVRAAEAPAWAPPPPESSAPPPDPDGAADEEEAAKPETLEKEEEEEEKNQPAEPRSIIIPTTAGSGPEAAAAAVAAAKEAGMDKSMVQMLAEGVSGGARAFMRYGSLAGQSIWHGVTASIWSTSAESVLSADIVTPRQEHLNQRVERMKSRRLKPDASSKGAMDPATSTASSPTKPAAPAATSQAKSSLGGLSRRDTALTRDEVERGGALGEEDEEEEEEPFADDQDRKLWPVHIFPEGGENPDEIAVFDIIKFALLWAVTNDPGNMIRATSWIVYEGLYAVVKPLLLQELFDVYVPAGDLQSVGICIAILVGITCIYAQATYGIKVSSPGGGGFVPRMMLSLAKRMIGAHQLYLDTNMVTSLLATLHVAIPELDRTMDQILQMISAFVVLISSWVALFMISWEMSIVLVFIMPMYYLYNKHKAPEVERVWEAMDSTQKNMFEMIEERVNSASVLRLLGLQKHFSKSLAKGTLAWQDAWDWQGEVESEHARGLKMLSLVAGLTVMAVGAMLVSQTDRLSLGGFIAFYAAAEELSALLESSSDISQMFSASMAGLRELLKLHKIEEDVVTPADLFGDGPVDIEIRDILFSYPSDPSVGIDALPPRPVNHLNLDIPAGTKMGILGRSGEGKSTFLKLLTRLYYPESGTITVGGRPLDDVPMPATFAVMEQDCMLFQSLDVEQNIAVGTRATLDEVKRACKHAMVDTDITGVEGGYKARVGYQGKKFSGGQRQRISLARTLLRNTPVYVFDEPVAFQDARGIKGIGRTLARLTYSPGRGKPQRPATVVAITHTVSMIAEWDLAVVFANGVAADIGPLEQLRASGGQFAQLVAGTEGLDVDDFGQVKVAPSRLQDLWLFSRVEEDLLLPVASAFQGRSCTEGEIVFQSGLPQDALTILVDGGLEELKEEASDEEGKPGRLKRVRMWMPGDQGGEQALVQCAARATSSASGVSSPASPGTPTADLGDAGSPGATGASPFTFQGVGGGPAAGRQFAVPNWPTSARSNTSGTTVASLTTKALSRVLATSPALREAVGETVNGVTRALSPEEVRRLWPLSGLGGASLYALSKCFDVKVVRPGSRLFNWPKDPCSRLYVLVSGSVELTTWVPPRRGEREGTVLNRVVSGVASFGERYVFDEDSGAGRGDGHPSFRPGDLAQAKQEKGPSGDVKQLLRAETKERCVVLVLSRYQLAKLDKHVGAIRDLTAIDPNALTSEESKALKDLDENPGMSADTILAQVHGTVDDEFRLRSYEGLRRHWLLSQVDGDVLQHLRDYLEPHTAAEGTQLAVECAYVVLRGQMTITTIRDGRLVRRTFHTGQFFNSTALTGTLAEDVVQSVEVSSGVAAYFAIEGDTFRDLLSHVHDSGQGPPPPPPHAQGHEKLLTLARDGKAAPPPRPRQANSMTADQKKAKGEKQERLTEPLRSLMRDRLEMISAKAVEEMGLGNLPEEDQRVLVDTAAGLFFDPGVDIFSDGSEDSFICMVLRGEVDVFAEARGGLVIGGGGSKKGSSRTRGDVEEGSGSALAAGAPLQRVGQGGFFFSTAARSLLNQAVKRMPESSIRGTGGRWPTRKAVQVPVARAMASPSGPAVLLVINLQELENKEKHRAIALQVEMMAETRADQRATVNRLTETSRRMERQLGLLPRFRPREVWRAALTKIRTLAAFGLLERKDIMQGRHQDPGGTLEEITDFLRDRISQLKATRKERIEEYNGLLRRWGLVGMRRPPLAILADKLLARHRAMAGGGEVDDAERTGLREVDDDDDDDVLYARIDLSIKRLESMRQYTAVLGNRSRDRTEIIAKAVEAIWKRLKIPAAVREAVRAQCEEPGPEAIAIYLKEIRARNKELQPQMEDALEKLSVLFKALMVPKAAQSQFLELRAPSVVPLMMSGTTELQATDLSEKGIPWAVWAGRGDFGTKALEPARRVRGISERSLVYSVASDEEGDEGGVGGEEEKEEEMGAPKLPPPNLAVVIKYEREAEELARLADLFGPLVKKITIRVKNEERKKAARREYVNPNKWA